MTIPQADSEISFDEFPEGTTIFCSPSDDLLKKTKIHTQASVLIISGPQTGQYYFIDRSKGVTLGSSHQANIQVSDIGVSRTHLHLYWENRSAWIKDLGSANGTFVNGERIDRELALKEGDLITLGAETTLRFTLSSQLEIEYQEKIRDQLTHDSLTKLFNKRTMVEYLNKEFSFSKRHGTDISVLMIDIDFFKKINDHHGHINGDKCLVHLASLLQSLSRKEDYVCRYGGEEFCIICRNLDYNESLLFAQRILSAVDTNSVFIDNKKINFTVSIGISSYPMNKSENVVNLLEHADKGLYRAKENGRNCAWVYFPGTRHDNK